MFFARDEFNLSKKSLLRCRYMLYVGWWVGVYGFAGWNGSGKEEKRRKEKHLLALRYIPRWAITNGYN